VYPAPAPTQPDYGAPAGWYAPGWPPRPQQPPYPQPTNAAPPGYWHPGPQQGWQYPQQPQQPGYPPYQQPGQQAAQPGGTPHQGEAISQDGDRSHDRSNPPTNG
ncbi:MAG: cell division protein FtsH, partial [Mycolicibacterium hassiacum]|nr:cell division protein FtsH [Mycolicibacterium hassiacum]